MGFRQKNIDLCFQKLYMNHDVLLTECWLPKDTCI